jgi:hypothetical protein
MGKLLPAIVFFSCAANLTSFSRNSNVPKLFDKFGNICCEDEKARSDNFAIRSAPLNN